MNGYALLPLCGFVCNVGLAQFVLAKNPRAAPNRWYALLATAIAWWSIVKFARLLVDDPEAARYLFAVSAPGWCLLPSLYLAFVVAFVARSPARGPRSALLALHLVGVAFAALAFVPGAMVTGMVREPWGYVHRPGPAYRVFGLYLVALFVVGLVLLLRARAREPSPAARSQYTYLVVGILVPLLGGVVTNMALPIAGIHVVELGEVLSTVHAAVIAYAMARHGLLSVSLEQAADAILETMGDPLLVADRNGDVAFTNPAAAALLGVEPAALVGRPARGLLRSPDLAIESGALDVELHGSEGELVPDGGEPIPVILSARPVRGSDGDLVGSVIVAKDIRALRRVLVDLECANQRLGHQAITDELTGLFNRREADRRLREAWEAGVRSGRPIAVGLLDLDDFKGINDTHGHQAGDQALQAVAASVQASLRASDVVARWGGDELLVILHDADAQRARMVGERIMAGVRAAHVPDCDVTVGASLGLAVLEPQASGADGGNEQGGRATAEPEDPEALVARADRALYLAKHEGKARVVLG